MKLRPQTPVLLTQGDVRTALLLPGDSRLQAYMQHPVLRGKQRVPTNPLNKAYQLFKEVLDTTELGIAFYCAPRNGKTTALNCIEEYIALEYPNLPVIRTSAATHADTTEKSQWTDILEDLGHEVGRTAAHLRSDLIKLIIAAAKANQSDDVVVMVDEAQNWDLRQWHFFKDVTNAVDLRAKIRVVTVSFGQLELMNVRNAVLKRTDLTDRFFPTIHEFKGVTGVQDLKTIFSQYDNTEGSEWPDDSGICFSEFLMPRAYAGKWRLEEEMEQLWRAFKDTGVPFKYVKASAVFLTVKKFFSQNYHLDSEGFEGDPKKWRAAIDSSNFWTLHPKK